MRQIWVALLCLAFCGLALADGPGAVRKRAEASMLVTGWVVVAPDGHVQSHELNKQEQLPPEVVDLIRRSTVNWRFEPVMLDGKPVAAKAKMSLRVVAKREDGGDNFAARVAGATFGEPGAADPVTYKNGGAPKYPEQAMRGRVSGTVYLLVRVDRSGKVADVAAEQVNLEVVDSDKRMQAWRGVLADASIKAARKWTYNVPTSGPHANDDSWIIRVPIAYHMLEAGQSDADNYGRWQTYIPGPKEPVPWLSKYPQANDDKGNATDALADNGLHMVGSGIRLMTPLDHS
ncbi:energy transducer TonB [Dyella subtropica]|uniref:energy transducer TonB n=1 Tax=Dyella subtropica TaxID=2992127 RepID=UPI002252246F|nr:energy transducer TonB [Dyella subtropica]